MLEATYYVARDYINEASGVNETGQLDLDRAFYYIVLRQLCFSGMERYNSNGEFNVPFGHYKSFSCNLTEKHHEFLSECEITSSGFETVNIQKGDFIFLDPPYLDRLGYSVDSASLHTDLFNFVCNLDNPWLLIHSDHEFYFENYKCYNIVTNDFTYGQRFGKDKDHSGASTQHLYISNLDTSPKFYSGTKESLQEELIDIIENAGLKADRDIISKLTGKACQYFIDIL